MADPSPDPPFRVDAAALLDEVQRFQARLAEGVGRLRDLGQVDLATTPREAVHHDGKLTLYRYRPARPRPELGPLLIVYALVNRPTMTDLQPDRSLVRGLLDAGVEVYLVDWGYPDAGDRGLTLDDYVNRQLHRCVKRVAKAHGGTPVNLLGICQGGTLSLCYAALHPKRVARLVTMVTPVDFHTPDNLLGQWARALDVDLLVDTLGNVPGEWLNWTFMALKPFRLTGQKYVDLVDLVDDPDAVRNFVRMEKWIFDSPDQAGEAFREFVKGCFQRNGLVAGTLEIGGKRIDLKRVTMPVLNVYATADHLVPPAASQALRGLVGSDDYSEHLFRGGHIGIYVSGRARQVPAEVAAWLAARAVPAADAEAVDGRGKVTGKDKGKKKPKERTKGSSKAKEKGKGKGKDTSKAKQKDNDKTKPESGDGKAKRKPQARQAQDVTRTEGGRQARRSPRTRSSEKPAGSTQPAGKKATTGRKTTRTGRAPS